MVEGYPGYERVGPEGVHGIYHHAAGTAAAQRFHDGRGDGSDKVGIQPAPGDGLGNGRRQELHGARCPEDGDGHEHGYQVGDDGYGGFETLLGAVDECGRKRLSFSESGYQEADDDGEQQYVGAEARIERDLLLRQLDEKCDDGADKQGEPRQPGEDHLVEEVDALV